MSFEAFDFNPSITKGISACGYTTPTPIQEKAIPPIMKGSDVLGLAQTGTGKTAAFVLPMLERLGNCTEKKPQALILAPTRELAEQTHSAICELGEKTGVKSVAIYGGVGKSPQIKAIRAGAQIIVACPGRLLDLLNDGAFKLDATRMLVLDEADQMFDKGFLPDIKRIIKQLPQKRQSLVFSATMPKEIKVLADNLLHNPATIRINDSLPLPAISHTVFNVNKENRTALLKSLFQKDDMKSALVFTRTKHKAKSLAMQLKKAGYSATSLQGNLSQQKRDKAMSGFRQGFFNILIATDIAARGIDVLGISHVINYDLPDTVETYTHRTGRTGRAEQKGNAYSFAGRDDKKMLSLIEKNLGKKMHKAPMPGMNFGT
ncbi:MAG: DEAD/DEAH box helicase [Desulfobacteraceae bacterium]